MRAHSKFSASGAERWFNCSASVEASVGQPDRESPWAIEGTKAHGVLERFLLDAIHKGRVSPDIDGPEPTEMRQHAARAAHFIWDLKKKLDCDVLVENRIYLDFIHPEMFGTFDSAVLDHFGTLHVFDYKYGAGHAVSPKNNLQMIFYGLGLAYKYNWNFSNAKLWIIQPRISGYQGPTYWQLPIEMLKSYVTDFRQAVWRVENNPEFREGSWCHWCKAKSVCPLKTESKLEKAKDVFKSITI